MMGIITLISTDMIKEDYCSIEVAKLLKEKGFDESIFEFYIGNKDTIRYARNKDGYRLSELDGDFYFPRITLQTAMKWLRDMHIIIAPVPSYFSGEDCPYWETDIWVGGNYEKRGAEKPTYEEAIETALIYVLTNLI